MKINPRVLIASLVILAIPLFWGKTSPSSDFVGKVDLTPTSGLMNPAITQNNLATTICDGDGGWKTDLVRPSNSVTSKIKKRMMAEIGTKLPSSAFQLDHIVPLTIGGASLEPNLQLQPIKQARQKDIYEKYLWKQVCNGEVTLIEAQRRISTDWNKYFQKSNSLGAMVVDEDDI